MFIYFIWFGAPTEMIISLKLLIKFGMEITYLKKSNKYLSIDLLYSYDSIQYEDEHM